MIFSEYFRFLRRSEVETEILGGKKMKVIAGLGNPGKEYEGTRHNAGAMVVDLLSRKHGIMLKRKAFNGFCGVGRIEGIEIMLFRPATYMNLSGEALKSVSSRKLGETSDLLVICDDAALPSGMIRLKDKGSSGGHNGLRSIIQHIGEDFARLRVGVGSPGYPGDMKRYVLDRFSPDEKAAIDSALERAVFCAEEWLRSGPGRAMNMFNERNVQPGA